MKVLAIAGVNVRRLLRERSNLFFVFVFPMLLILVLGSAFSGQSDVHIGVVSAGAGPLGEQLAAAIGAGDHVVAQPFTSEDALVSAVQDGTVSAGVVIPPGYDQALRDGGNVQVRFLSQPTSGTSLRSEVQAAVAAQTATIRGARFLQAEAKVPFDQALGTATLVARALPSVDVHVETAGRAVFPDTLGTFDLGASSQLLLFVFLTSLTSSAALIETRQLGISRRMLATPTRVSAILAGEALGRFGVAMVQGVFIMLASLVAFGVHWGNPVGAAAVMVVFALVGTGAGMLVGSTFSNAEQAGPAGLLIGLGLAALGGAMVPLELFTPLMRRIAHVTPHAWALDAFAELVRRGGGVGDILPQLGVLLAYAAVLLVLATWRLRAALT